MTADEKTKALAEPTIDPKTTFKILDLSPASGYAAIARGEIQTFRIGGKILVPTGPLRRKLMLDI